MQICDLKTAEGTGDKAVRKGGKAQKGQLNLQLLQKLIHQTTLKTKPSCAVYIELHIYGLEFGLGMTSVDLVIVSFSENNVQGCVTLTTPYTGGFARFIFREWNPLQPSVFTSQPPAFKTLH